MYKSMEEILYGTFEASIGEEFWSNESVLAEGYAELNNGEQLTADMKSAHLCYGDAEKIKYLLVRIGGDEYRVTVEKSP